MAVTTLSLQMIDFPLNTLQGDLYCQHFHHFRLMNLEMVGGSIASTAMTLPQVLDFTRFYIEIIREIWYVLFYQIIHESYLSIQTYKRITEINHNLFYFMILNKCFQYQKNKNLDNQMLHL